ncbi:hypothetical protein GCM10009639_31150 [Kitasatospora putterlickiae]|uniref:Uncharacterized protein n=1 Tax=Kitasatospora putterlickiae TaxID=221725 RepID=A0ABN1Y489_9ACTN
MVRRQVGRRASGDPPYGVAQHVARGGVQVDAAQRGAEQHVEVGAQVEEALPGEPQHGGVGDREAEPGGARVDPAQEVGGQGEDGDRQDVGQHAGQDGQVALPARHADQSVERGLQHQVDQPVADREPRAQAEPSAGQRVEGLVQGEQRRLAEEQQQHDQGVGGAEEQVVHARDQGGDPDHLGRGERGEQRVADQRGPAEDRPPQALPAHRRGPGGRRRGRLAGGAEQIEVGEDLDQVGDVDALAVRPPVALGGLAGRGAVVEQPDQFGAVGREDGVGVGLGAADGDLVALLQVDEPAQGQRAVQVEARGVGAAVHGGVHGPSCRRWAEDGRGGAGGRSGAGRDAPGRHRVSPYPGCGSELLGHDAVPRQVQRASRAGQTDRAGLADDDLLHDGHLLP